MRKMYQKVIRNEYGVTPKIAETRELRWNKMYYELIVFREANHQNNPSKTSADKAEKRLASWWQLLKKLYRENQLDEQWRIKAETLGVNIKRVKYTKVSQKVAETRTLRWNKMYQALVEFRAANPYKNPSYSSSDIAEKRLSNWWGAIKKMYREKTLHQEWVEKVEAIGIKVKKEIIKKSKETRMAEKMEAAYQNLIKFIELSNSKNETNTALKKLAVDETTQQMAAPKLLPHQLPSQYSKDKSERKLYIFIYKMKMLYKQHQLSDDWINKLSTIGIVLEKKTSRYSEKQIENWVQNYDDLIEFRKQHPTKWPNTYRRTDTEKRLFFWLKNLKKWERKNKLEQEWIDKLQEIGYNFTTEYRINGRRSAKESWQINVQKLIDFKQQNEGRFPNLKSADEGEKKLAAWLQNSKHLNKINKLAAERKQDLDDLGFSFEKVTNRASYRSKGVGRKHNSENFYEKYNLLIEFLKTSSNKFPSRRDSNPAAKKLGIWLGNLKIAHKNNLLPIEWKEKMEEIGFSVEKLQSRRVANLPPYQYRKTGINLNLFHKTYDELIEFRKQYPDKWPSIYKPISNQEAHLGSWINWLRIRYKKNELPQDIIEKIQATGCRLETGEASKQKIMLARWNNKTQELLAFKKNHHRWPVRKTPDITERRLSRWMDHFKSNRVKEKMPNEWIEQLKEAGFLFTDRNSSSARTSKGYHDAKYAQLLTFKEQNPGKWPSRVLGSDIEKGLAIWLVNLKSNYRRNKNINQELLNKIQAIGYNLAAGKKELEEEMFIRWTVRYYQLLNFIEENNNLPKKSTSNNLEKTLRSWVERMRRFYRLNKMPDEWSEKLIKIGVIVPNKT